MEAQNFEARKHLLEYDDVMNKQRETVYSLRRSFLEGRDQKEFVLERAEAIAQSLVETYCPRDQHPDQWNVTQFGNELLNQFGIDLKAAIPDIENLNHDQLADELMEKVHARYEEKEKLFGAQTLRWLERHILLDIVDAQWKDHLLTLDHLKEGIGLRGYGQKDPLVEFKSEAFTLFEDMMDRIDTEAVRFLFLVRPGRPGQARPAARRNRRTGRAQMRGRTARRQRRILKSRARFNSGSNGSRGICSSRPGRRRRKRPSRCGRRPKWGETIRVPAGRERNTRSAMAPPRRIPSQILPSRGRLSFGADSRASACPRGFRMLASARLIHF